LLSPSFLFCKIKNEIYGEKGAKYMAKGLNKIQVGLTFTADTGNAKAQLKDLKR
jgi:hypothetical protein